MDICLCLKSCILIEHLYVCQAHSFHMFYSDTCHLGRGANPLSHFVPISQSAWAYSWFIAVICEHCYCDVILVECMLSCSRWQLKTSSAPSSPCRPAPQQARAAELPSSTARAVLWEPSRSPSVCSADPFCKGWPSQITKCNAIHTRHIHDSASQDRLGLSRQQLLSVILPCDFCTGHRRQRSPTSLSLSGCLRVRGSRRHLGRSLCPSDLSKRVVALLPNLARFTAAFAT